MTALKLAVRLIDKRTGKPVAGAVVFRTRLDMSPDSMGEMEAKPPRRRPPPKPASTA